MSDTDISKAIEFCDEAFLEHKLTQQEATIAELQAKLSESEEELREWRVIKALNTRFKDRLTVSGEAAGIPQPNDSES